MTDRRKIALLPLFLIFFRLALYATSDGPWEQNAFAANPQAILTAVAKIPVEKNRDSTYLFDERFISVDETGRCKRIRRKVYRIDTAGLQNLASLSRSWEPWHQNRPVIRVRVITPDGVEHMLDQSTVSDAPSRTDAPDVFDDNRVTRAPFPAVSIGAVVEFEVTTEDTAPYFDGGTLQRVFVGSTVPVRSASIHLRIPKSVKLRYETRLLPALSVEKHEADGVVQVDFSSSRIEAIDKTEPLLPTDVADWPQIEFSTVPSWQAVASGYASLTEGKIQTSQVKSLVEPMISPGQPQLEKIRALVKELHKQVRYTGIEFGESKLVPQFPSATLERKYGDCKDKSTLLVAMLRAANIPAYLALLRVGERQDVTPSLPGMGLFDHAIVFVPGKPDLWIDATDEYSAVGSLPIGDQGRLALVVRPDTTALSQIPVSAPSENLLVEHREFFLSELGPARVVEDSESHGAIDRTYRFNYGRGETKENRKELEGYVKNAYMADELTKFEHGDGRDFSKPFQLRLEMSKASRGQTSLADAAAAIPVAGAAGRLPSYFRADPDADKNEKKDDKEVPRTTDFKLPYGFVTEWQCRIVPPPGFKVRPLPESRTEAMGPAQLRQEYKSESDGTVLATIHFDSGKGQYTVAEAKALRDAVLQLNKARMVVIRFDQIGAGLQANGKVREALDNYEGLAKLHPTEALHHVQQANALLEAGLAEEARDQAKRAVELEPQSALAHRTLGWVLEHDLVGRRLRKGFDLAGSTAAYRKAIEIDAKDESARSSLAILLEYDAQGNRYTSNSQLNAAIEQYQELKKNKSTWDGLDDNLLLDYFYASKFKEAQQLISDLPSTLNRRAIGIAAKAAGEGAKAGIQESFATSDNEKDRIQVLSNAGILLMRIHRYEEAAEVLSETGDASSLETLEAIRKTSRYDALPKTGQDASSAVLKMLVLIAGSDEPKESALDCFSLGELTPEKRKQHLEYFASLSRLLRGQLGESGIPEPARGDVMLSNLKITDEGNDELGYRVTIQGIGLNGFHVFGIRQNKEIKLLWMEDIPSLGKQALNHLEHHKADLARTWLDWAREEQSLQGGDDIFAGPVFPRFWNKGEDGSPARMKVAAASILAESEDAKLGIGILQQARAAAKTPEEQQNLNLVLAKAYASLKQWPSLRDSATELLKEAPTSLTAFRLYTTSCAFLSDWKCEEDSAQKRIQLVPDDGNANLVLADAAERQGDLKHSLEILRPRVLNGKATVGELNNFAWDMLFMEKVPSEAVEAAQRANRLEEGKDVGVLHTLACLYAEIGRTNEARQMLLQGMDQLSLEEPNSIFWYGFGRIAEQYREYKSALSAYKRVETPAKEEDRSNSTFALTQLHMQKINAAEEFVTKSSAPSK